MFNGQDRRHVAVVVTSDGRRVSVPLNSGLDDVSLIGILRSLLLGWTAFSGLLPAPGGRTEELGGTDARRRDHRRPKGPSPGGEGFLLPADRVAREGRGERSHDDDEGSAGEAAESDARRSHVPGDGTSSAAAVERARKSMLDDSRPRRRTRIGADVVCEALLRQGVDVFFSYPGGVILPLYDVLGDYPELRHILVRHEQGGAHAADGYARVTGRVGVCMGTSGPGATNLVTGIGTALLDSVPMVAITGNVPSALIGKDAFQEIDINGITLPMTKHNYLVRNADELPRVIAEAFHIARTRAGPGRSTSTSRRTPSSRRRAPSTRPTRRSSRACPASARTSTPTAAS